jgi:hypothetical protein
MSLVSIKLEAAEGEPLRIGTQHGRTYLGGKLDQRYNLVVTNNGWRRIAVVVTIDGKNVLDGKPGDPDGEAMVIQGNSYYAFKGWRTSMSEVAAFRLVDVGESYAAKTGDGSNVGVVGCAVFEEKQPVMRMMATPTPAAFPMGASMPRGSGVRGQSFGGGGIDHASLDASPTRSTGTGFGETVESKVTTTNFDRATETPAEVHVLYYDTVANLITRGILPADGGPNPFPAKPEMAFCQPPK